MKTCLICPIRNENTILPFFFRHYDDAIDHYVFYDGLSDDGTRELIAANPKAEICDNDTHGMTDDGVNARIKGDAYKSLPGYDWYIIVDTDEFIYSPRGIRAELAECEKAGARAVLAEGWDMIGDEIPTGGLLTNSIKFGVRDVSPYHLWHNKIVAVHASVDISFGPGAHKSTMQGAVSIGRNFKLLHYKYLSRNYTAFKAANCTPAPANHKNLWGYINYNGRLMLNRDTWVDYYDRARAMRERVIE